MSIPGGSDPFSNLPGAPTPGQQPAQPMPGTPGAPAAPSSRWPEQSQAVLALILGIVGLFSCGITSVVGFFIARKELDGIDQGRRDPANHGTARAAKIISIVVTCFILIWVLLFVFTTVLGLGALFITDRAEVS